MAVSKKKKPKRFSVVLYPKPVTQVTYTSFGDPNENPDARGVIITHHYCLDINYPLSVRNTQKIQAFVKKLLK